ncbi:MAG: hypothetical protein QNK11_10020 [Legionella sp.]|nr:hypothetical protein [Legionella sp.]
MFKAEQITKKTLLIYTVILISCRENILLNNSAVDEEKEKIELTLDFMLRCNLNLINLLPLETNLSMLCHQNKRRRSLLLDAHEKLLLHDVDNNDIEFNMFDYYQAVAENLKTKYPFAIYDIYLSERYERAFAYAKLSVIALLLLAYNLLAEEYPTELIYVALPFSVFLCMNVSFLSAVTKDIMTREENNFLFTERLNTKPSASIYHLWFNQPLQTFHDKSLGEALQLELEKGMQPTACF